MLYSSCFVKMLNYCIKQHIKYQQRDASVQVKAEGRGEECEHALATRALLTLLQIRRILQNRLVDIGFCGLMVGLEHNVRYPCTRR